MSPEKLLIERRRMVEGQLRRRGIRSERVLEAMYDVPRERFVPEPLEPEAHADRALGIDCGQTISQPFMVALMTEALELAGDEKVLEVGTGSGYQTAVLSRLARRVISVERHEPLAHQAEEALRELGCENVTVVVGDGSQGWPEEAPYDRIIVTAGAEQTPQPLIDQLADGGRLVIPVGPGSFQTLQAIQKVGDELRTTALCECRFVPLVGS